MRESERAGASLLYLVSLSGEGQARWLDAGCCRVLSCKDGGDVDGTARGCVFARLRLKAAMLVPRILAVLRRVTAGRPPPESSYAELQAAHGAISDLQERYHE